MTTDTLRQVFGTLRTPNGSPFPNKSLKWFRERRTAVAQGSSVVLDDPFIVTTDAQGDIDTAVMAGAYLVMAPLSDADRYFRVVVPDQAGPFDISSLIDGPVVEPDDLTQFEALVAKAKAWANSPEDTAVEGGEFSAKHYAAKAQEERVGAQEAVDTAVAASLAKAEEWADNPEDVEVEAGQYSAKHWAAKSEEQKEAALAARTSAENSETEAYAARDAAFVNANVYADTAAGLAAVSLGEQFQVVSGEEIIRYREDSGPVATEVARFPAKSFVDKITLFPGRVGWVAVETAAFPRIKSLALYGANPAKFYFVKFLFWKDVGTRFTITISAADDLVGTGVADVAVFTVSSGADSYATPLEINLVQTGGSGVSGVAIIDFTDPSAMLVNIAPSTAAMFARRQITPVMEIGAARRTDIGVQAGTALNIRNRATQVSAFAGGNAGNDSQTGLRNAGFGYGALDSLTSGTDNSAFGQNALTTITTGSFASAFGSQALEFSTGDSNSAFGYQAGRTVNTGARNNLFGFQAGFSLTTGGDNLALGHRALFLCSTASFNTAVGVSALQTFTGTGATALGNEAAFSATTATNLTAIGRRAARSKVSGADETYLGFQAGWSGQVKANNGDGNTGIGAFALGHNTTGSSNTACGRAAGWYGDTAAQNAWLGFRCGYGLATGGNNVGVGFYSIHNLNVGSRNVALGALTDAFVPVSDAMTATAVAGSGLSVGAYTYRVSFVIDGAETALSELPRNVTTTGGNQQVNLASIPTYSGPRVCSARRIYRTPVGGENLYYLVGTLADNTTTTFSDTTPDASLTTQPDAVNNSIAIGHAARFMKSGQMVVGSSLARITEVVIGGGVDDPVPAALTLQSSNASGTNVSGADLRLGGGRGTGSGNGGRVILSAAAPGASGSTHNAPSDWVTLDGRGFLNILETTSASVPTPAAGSVNLFVEGGALKFRDSGGIVRTVATS